MIWFYLTAFILLLGAELNAVIAQAKVPEQLAQTAEEGSPQAAALQAKSGAAHTKSRHGPTRLVLALVQVAVGAVAVWKFATRQRAGATSTQST
jgi:hypothetical protein